jgi:hypothetical protein
MAGKDTPQYRKNRVPRMDKATNTWSSKDHLPIVWNEVTRALISQLLVSLYARQALSAYRAGKNRCARSEADQSHVLYPHKLASWKNIVRDVKQYAYYAAAHVYGN